ncbi:MAG TPA: aminoglycoside phosphotransferase family protein [Acetobacteraceae bacterium]
MGDAHVVSVERVSGGLVHSNLRLTLDRPPGRVLLRLFQRDPQRARKEAALAALLEGRVPIARFLHFADSNPITGGPYAVLEWVDGVQLDHLSRAADPATLNALGVAVGDALAHVHAFRFDRAGFFGPDLYIAETLDLGRTGLLQFMHQCLRAGPGGERLGHALTDRLFAFVEQEGQRLDGWLGDPRLTHADCNPSNILLRQIAADWHVAAVLDWEFALSATPAFDFGNLLRLPLGGQTAFVGGVVTGYGRAGGTLPAGWRPIARIADLFAWSDLLGQRDADAAVAQDARQAIVALLDKPFDD